MFANYLLNKVPKKKGEKTPSELWRGRQSSYKYFRVWECLAKVAVPPPKKVKIGPKSVLRLLNLVANTWKQHEEGERKITKERKGKITEQKIRASLSYIEDAESRE